MPRIRLSAMLCLAACELLGGCAQTTTVRQPLPVTARDQPPSAPHDAGANPIRSETMRQQIDNAEHATPYADMMTYPDNWPEITRRRDGDSP